jgi:radical SAM superfamily enzyme YgiQ (UPF0313 family)
MRVALVNPPWMYKRLYTHGIYPPYGLLMLATQLALDGHEVTVIDANAHDQTEADVQAELLRLAPDVFGITVFTDTFGFLERMGPWWRQHFGNRPLVIGGPLVSGAPATCMAASQATAGTIGEAFLSGPALFRALEKGESLQSLAGLVLPKPDGSLHHTGPTPQWHDLDALPLPDWELLPVRKYVDGGPQPYFRKRRLRRYLSTITTLGCTFRCTFCQVPNLYEGVRARSPKLVAEEIAGYQARYGIESMYFRDDILFRPGKIADALAEAVPGLQWSCLLRADMMTDGVLRRMAAGGCREIRVGFESGDDLVLDKVNKRTEVSDNVKCIEVARKHNVDVSGFLIVGLPGETVDSLRNTERFVRETGVRASVHFPLPLPGTELYEEGKRSGQIPDEVALLRQFSEPQLPGAVLQPPPVNYTDLPPEVLVEWAMRIAEAGRQADREADEATEVAHHADAPF